MEKKTNVLHVCEYFRERDSSSEALATLLSSASAFLLNSLALSLTKPPLSVYSACLDSTTSVISAGFLWRLQKQSLLVLIQSQRDLGEVFRLSVPS